MKLENYLGAKNLMEKSLKLQKSNDDLERVFIELKEWKEKITVPVKTGASNLVVQVDRAILYQLIDKQIDFNNSEIKNLESQFKKL